MTRSVDTIDIIYCVDFFGNKTLQTEGVIEPTVIKLTGDDILFDEHMPLSL